MAGQIPISVESKHPQHEAGAPRRLPELTPDLVYQRLVLSNVIFYGRRDAGDREWVLIDAGVPGTAARIQRAAAERFGYNSRPYAIILTHGHFDHVGALEHLARLWNVPIYAHELERPYLNGNASYPPPDPTVGGGMLATLSRFYPRGPVNVSRWLRPLPEGGEVPGMHGWRWLFTPGHTPGHISLWREADRALIAGDAVITTRQESMYAVALQKPEIHGPPTYYTQNWEDAGRSVQRLAALQPKLLVTGHGHPLRGEAMQRGLTELARHFQRVAVPRRGRYVSRTPAPYTHVAEQTFVTNFARSRGIQSLGLTALIALTARRMGFKRTAYAVGAVGLIAALRSPQRASRRR